MTLEQINDFHDCNLTPSQLDTLRKPVPLGWNDIIAKTADEAKTHSLLVFLSCRESSQKQVCISTLSCKLFYGELIFDAFRRAKHELRNRKTQFYDEWAKRFGPISWPRIFSSLYRNHIDRRTVDLIYRCLHSSITTRIKLFNANLSDHRLCTRCYVAPETGMHIFVGCVYSARIWEKAAALVAKVFPESCRVDPARAIIVGYADIKMPKEVLHAIEDIRLAYFKSVYTQRYQSLFKHSQIDGIAVFSNTLNSYVQTRFHMAEQKGDLSEVRPFDTIVKKDGDNVTVRIP